MSNHNHIYLIFSSNVNIRDQISVSFKLGSQNRENENVFSL